LIGDFCIQVRSKKKLTITDVTLQLVEARDRSEQLINSKIELGLLRVEFREQFSQLWNTLYTRLLLDIAYYKSNKNNIAWREKRTLSNFNLTCDAIQVMNNYNISSFKNKRFRSIKKRITKKIVKRTGRRL